MKLCEFIYADLTDSLLISLMRKTAAEQIINSNLIQGNYILNNNYKFNSLHNW